METTSILTPDATAKLSTGETVTVKLLPWKRALEFFDKLDGAIKGLVNEEGDLVFVTTKIAAILKTNAGLAEWLVLETTGKGPEWLEKLHLGDMAKLTLKALEVNLASVAEEIKNVKGRLAILAAAGVQNSKSSQTLPSSATP